MNNTPPMVGVPNLAKWRWGPSMRIDSPDLQVAQDTQKRLAPNYRQHRS